MSIQLHAAENVILNAYMGAWYVIGHTPLYVDRRAYNPVEHYTLNDRGHIEVTYRFHQGGPNGPQKTYRSKAFVPDISQSGRWKIQWLWPFKADFIILHLSDDGQRTIVGHPSRKYAWIMQRVPQMDDATYAGMLDQLRALDFDCDRIQRAAQDWIEAEQ